MTYVIVSECERGFWSNQYGWVHHRDAASVFSNNQEFPLPLRARNEGSFLEISLAPEYYLEEPLACGDEVMRKDASESQAMRMWIDKIETADGYARTSEDVLVLRDSTGKLTTTVVRSVTPVSPLALAFVA